MNGMGPRINIINEDIKTQESEIDERYDIVPEKSFEAQIPKILMRQQEISKSRDIIGTSVDLGDHMNIHLENQHRSQKLLRTSYENNNNNNNSTR